VPGLLEEIDLADLPDPAGRIARALLPSLPDPARALHFLNRFVSQAPEYAPAIASEKSFLRAALTLFSYSGFLAEAVLRRPEWLTEVVGRRELYRDYLREDYEERLLGALPKSGLPKPADLALFRRRQLLRIVLRDVLRIADLSETTEDLSNLADAILNVTLRAVRAELNREYGPVAGDFSAIAVGKLGGRELNYSSDIDLIFVYAGEELTSGTTVSAREFFRRAANILTELLSAYSPEGICYRVDLRLRPEGTLGEICQSLTRACDYYSARARGWELQMLIKARLAAGDTAPCARLLQHVEPLIYSPPGDFRALEAVSETRVLIHEKQSRKRADAGVDIKLTKGGIRDIEFLVQCLQRLHGGREPWVRNAGTLLALSRLRDKELLSTGEYARLASAYQFLRRLEHRLQFDDDRQTHTLPRDKDALDVLARKMPPVAGALQDASALEAELDRYLADVRDMYERVIGSRAPLVTEMGGAEPAETRSVNLMRYLAQRAPAFAALLSQSLTPRIQQSMESFLEKAVELPDLLPALDRSAELARCVIDIFGHSDHFAGQLIRNPRLLAEVEQACGERQGRTGFDPPDDPQELRRFFSAQMMRIQSDSLYHGVPVFLTLKRTSDLAEAVILAAYRIAVREVLCDAPPKNPSYSPDDRMLVIALGRLGMREFDLASDADLNFVIPDSDGSEILFWTAVAEHLISVVSAYTGDGVIFTIDTRLRPNGREGALVQTESAYKDYFARSAQAWEGMSWMKARTIAGDKTHGTRFLTAVQELDWRRYGQSGRSRTELARMRARLEREQGPRNPLKAGPGGYYDIDFVLMYLRLRGAELFFPVLNTPARIDVIEKMGHLDRDDVSFLLNAATLYRAVDHGMRISTGHAEGRLPTSPVQNAILTDLVRRWTPPGLIGDSLEQAIRRIRTETRALFSRIFGPM
jgi:glutamate-ammonia-ligase adenylyltransferase